MTMTVDKLMTRHIVSVDQATTVSDACELLLRHHVSGLPVLDGDNRLVGLVTEYDLMRILVDPVPPETAIAPYISRNCLALHPDDSLITALDLFRQHGFRRLPVVAEDGQLVGIIARRDFIRVIREAHRRIADSRGEIEGQEEAAAAR